MNLLLTGSLTYTASQLAALAAMGYHITFVQDERLPLEIDAENPDAVVCNSLFQSNDISRFKSLKFIQLTSAGTDRVPVDYIREKGIRLETARGVYSIPIAEWVLGKILELYKKSRDFYASQQRHQWEKQREIAELAGKSALILGYGSVGVEIARRLYAFDVKVTAIDSRTPAEIEMRWLKSIIAPDQLDKELPKHDIVISALPLTPQTQHLLNSERLALMKPTALLANVSRGGIIDEPALVTALQEGKFSGVALDVFENEPLPDDSPLWNMDNVLITPHNAFVSENNPDRLFRLIYENLKNAISNLSNR